MSLALLYCLSDRNAILFLCRDIKPSVKGKIIMFYFLFPRLLGYFYGVFVLFGA